MKKLGIILILSMVIVLFAQSPWNCLTLDGSDDYLTLPVSADFNYDGTSEMTFEAWVYLSSSSTYQGLFGKFASGAGTAQYDLFINHLNQLCFAIDHNATAWQYICNTSDALPTNTWVHVALVKTATDATLYVDGKNVSSNALNGTTQSAGASTGATLIGSSPNGTNKWNGMIEEIKIWSDARTPDEIREFMFYELQDPTGKPNLVAYYRLDASSGTTAMDNSANSYTANLTNMTGSEWTVSGAYEGSNYGLDFDGTDDHLLATNGGTFQSASAITIEAWVNVDNSYEYAGIIDNGFATGTPSNLCGGYLIGLNTVADKRFRFWTCNGTTYPTNRTVITSDINYIEDTWYHLAAVYDGSEIKLYVDGRLAGSASFSGTIDYTQVNLDPSYGFNIGRFKDDNEELLFDGMIDEVRIWNDARTQTEIREYMCRSLLGNETGLAAYYRMDDNGGLKAIDLVSGQNANLTNMDEATDWVPSGQFTTWIAPSATDFGTNGNWSDDAPSSTKSASFYSRYSTPAVLGSYTCDNFIIPTGETLDIISGSLGVVGNYYQHGDINFTAGAIGVRGNGFDTSAHRLISTSSADFTSKPLFE